MRKFCLSGVNIHTNYLLRNTLIRTMIDHVLMVSLFTIGYCCLFWPGMIFEKIGDMMEATLPEFINKPLWSCFICACFWWGSWAWAMILYDAALPASKLLVDWFFTVVPAMGLNAVISMFMPEDKE